MSSSGSLQRQLPHGLTDLFFEPAAIKTELERLLQETFLGWGYTRIIPPTFEYYDSLATGASPELQREMYRFFDREGHILALRTDVTVPTARVVGTKLYDQMLPLRLYYIGSVFRHDEPQAGVRREFTQAGIELIGAATAEADAETLALAVAALRAMGLVNFQINLGQVAFLKGILQDHELVNGELYRIEQAISRKNDVELAQTLAELGISGDMARAIKAIPHLCGDEGVLDEARRLATNDTARAAVERLARVYELVGYQGFADHVILDLGEVRSMAYYTGISFHGFAPGLGFPICSGGRYDGFIANYGADLPAVGFALGVERVMLITQPPVRIAPHLVIEACGHAEGHQLAALARERGLQVEVDVLGRRGEALITYGRARGADYIIGQENVDRYTLADAATTRTLTRRELEEEIRSWNR